MRMTITLIIALTLLAATGKVPLIVDAIKIVQNSGGVFDAAQKAIK